MIRADRILGKRGARGTVGLGTGSLDWIGWERA